MKKLISIYTIIFLTSALTACGGHHGFYNASPTYTSTQTPPAPPTGTSYSYSNDAPPSPSVGSTTYYTGVPANQNPPAASGYNSTQTPPAPPSGYSNNQSMNNNTVSNPPMAGGYSTTPINNAKLIPQTNDAVRNDYVATSQATSKTTTTEISRPAASNVIPVGKLVAIHREEDANKKLPTVVNTEKSDKAAAMMPDVR